MALGLNQELALLALLSLVGVLACVGVARLYVATADYALRRRVTRARLARSDAADFQDARFSEWPDVAGSAQ